MPISFLTEDNTYDKCMLKQNVEGNSETRQNHFIHISLKTSALTDTTPCYSSPDDNGFLLFQEGEYIG